MHSAAKSSGPTTADGDGKATSFASARNDLWNLWVPRSKWSTVDRFHPSSCFSGPSNTDLQLALRMSWVADLQVQIISHIQQDTVSRKCIWGSTHVRLGCFARELSSSDDEDQIGCVNRPSSPNHSPPALRDIAASIHPHHVHALSEHADLCHTAERNEPKSLTERRRQLDPFLPVLSPGEIDVGTTGLEATRWRPSLLETRS